MFFTILLINSPFSLLPTLLLLSTVFSSFILSTLLSFYHLWVCCLPLPCWSQLYFFVHYHQLYQSQTFHDFEYHFGLCSKSLVFSGCRLFFTAFLGKIMLLVNEFLRFYSASGLLSLPFFRRSNPSYSFSALLFLCFIYYPILSFLSFLLTLILFHGRTWIPFVPKRLTTNNDKIARSITSHPVFQIKAPQHKEAVHHQIF